MFALPEPALDLAQLDAEAAQFHLPVHAAQEFELAIQLPIQLLPIQLPIHLTNKAPARLVAAAIQTAFAERVGNELLGRQFRTIQIALGHTGSADV
ncbi:MAG: hypothetical protein ABI779_01270, partial [Acidobacteriota bacterium]